MPRTYTLPPHPPTHRCFHYTGNTASKQHARLFYFTGTLRHILVTRAPYGLKLSGAPRFHPAQAGEGREVPGGQKKVPFTTPALGRALPEELTRPVSSQNGTRQSLVTAAIRLKRGAHKAHKAKREATGPQQNSTRIDRWP